MQISRITASWLRKQNFKLEKGLTIAGCYLKDLPVFIDDRGDITELWSKKWADFKDGQISKTDHVYQSATDPGVVKCWHLHEEHTDQFTITRGKLQVCMVDLRTDSKTFGVVNSVIMGIQKPSLLVIPPGVMHGWKALGTQETIVVNFSTHIYDVKDELRFPWDCVLKEIWGPKNG
jgi:dTDP-4-dehydrorhamnose 3,5-epimerase